ncbi:hypothetical protein FACS1894202_00670 [Clostridia bacterium]|nr:hypothetical protein FACS1894202_00670 [Clostridia bacterium]
MRNLKKVLALAVVFAMVLSLGFTSVAATGNAANVGKTPFADGGDLKADYKAAAELLVNLDIVNGQLKGGERVGLWAETFTRGELAGLFAQVIDQSGAKLYQTYAPEVYSFEDVPAGHWAASSIYLLKDLGLVSGVNEEGTKFNPTGIVSAREVVTLALRALGYEVKRDVQFTGPTGTYFLSLKTSQLNLLDKVDTNIGNWTTQITREESFQILYKSLFAKVVAGITLPNAPGDWTYTEGAKTLLETLFPAYKSYTGALVANKYAAIPYLNGNTNEKTDGKVWLDIGKYTTAYGEETLVQVTGDIDELNIPANLGRTYSVSLKQNADGTFSTIDKPTAVNQVVEIKVPNNYSSAPEIGLKVANIVDNFSNVAASRSSLIRTGTGNDADKKVTYDAVNGINVFSNNWAWTGINGEQELIKLNKVFSAHAYLNATTGAYDYVFRDNYIFAKIEKTSDGKLVANLNESGGGSAKLAVEIKDAYVIGDTIAENDYVEIYPTNFGGNAINGTAIKFATIEKLKPIKGKQVSQSAASVKLNTGDTLYPIPNSLYSTFTQDSKTYQFKVASDTVEASSGYQPADYNAKLQSFKTSELDYYVFKGLTVAAIGTVVSTPTVYGYVVSSKTGSVASGSGAFASPEVKTQVELLLASGKAVYTTTVNTEIAIGLYELTNVDTEKKTVTVGAVHLPSPASASINGSYLVIGTSYYSITADSVFFSGSPTISKVETGVPGAINAYTTLVLDATNTKVLAAVVTPTTPTSTFHYGIVKNSGLATGDLGAGKNADYPFLAKVEVYNEKGTTDTFEFSTSLDNAQIAALFSKGSVVRYDSAASGKATGINVVADGAGKLAVVTTQTSFIGLDRGTITSLKAAGADLDALGADDAILTGLAVASTTLIVKADGTTGSVVDLLTALTSGTTGKFTKVVYVNSIPVDELAGKTAVIFVLGTKDFS